MKKRGRLRTGITLLILAALAATLLIFGQDWLDGWKAEKTKSELAALYYGDD
ncbi:MAG: hypothetical protein Q4D04_14910 [Clostridia bacterium]|nr:hypothetical protein [Clostridia bacterium]